MPPTGQRVAGDAMDFGVTEIRNKRAEKLGGVSKNFKKVWEFLKEEILPIEQTHMFR